MNYAMSDIHCCLTSSVAAPVLVDLSGDYIHDVEDSYGQTEPSSAVRLRTCLQR